MAATSVFARGGSGITSPTFGPDGKLYAASSQSGEIVTVTAAGVSPILNTSGMPTVPRPNMCAFTLW